jgi:3-hydroxyisobutyrate dehydrogenase
MVDTRVGFCGMGTMGAAMAANVARAGFRLHVWNRTRGRAAAPIEVGGTEADSPRAVAAVSNVVVICVSDTPDVESVLFDPDGVAAGLVAGSLVIDCSTIAPGATRQFATRLAEQGIGYVDAPVSGGSEGAEKGTLTIMVGGSEADVERAMPVLAAMGSTITHMGPSGAGQATKAVNQVILSGVYLGVAEGMVLAMKSGLDAEKVARALSGGAAGSWVLENRSGRMIDNEYPLGFRIALHLKDISIALELAREVGAALPVTALASQIEAGLVARGFGDDDNAALARAVREWSGL